MKKKTVIRLIIILIVILVILSFVNLTRIVRYDTQDDLHPIEAIKKYELSQDYVGYWRGEDETTDSITIYSINDDKIEFEWDVYRIGGIDRAIATLISENTATFDYNNGYGITFQGIITFGKDEISLEITKSEGFEYITSDYENTFNVKDEEYFAFIKSIM